MVTLFTNLAKLQDYLTEILTQEHVLKFRNHKRNKVRMAIFIVENII